jgi:hypothetical protein
MSRSPTILTDDMQGALIEPAFYSQRRSHE